MIARNDVKIKMLYPTNQKIRSRIDDFWDAVKKKMSAAFTPGAGCVKM